MVSMQPLLHTNQSVDLQESQEEGMKMREGLAPPPSKKLKVSTDDTSVGTDQAVKLDNLASRSSWSLRAVLGDDATLPVPLVPAIAAQVTDRKQTSNLIRKLNETLPLPSLQHLKRVKSYKDKDRTSIFLLLWRDDDHSSDNNNCDSDSSSNSNPEYPPSVIIDRLEAAGVDSSHFSDHFRRVMVAKFAPMTRQQFQELKASPSYWPCNFHEDKYFESLVTCTHELWSSENRAIQESHMSTALDSGGGVVVDPTSNLVIAQGHGTSASHPLHHTAMNLLDLIARSQGGGALDHTANDPSLIYLPNVTSNSCSTNGHGTSDGSNDSFSSNGGDTTAERPPAAHNHLKRFGSIAQLSTVPKTGPYLCTGYDVYLDREPCHMCSMALIHMRTRRVFYSRHTRDGALGTLDKIHTLEGLNHRFEVFTGILSKQPEDPDLTCC